LRFYHHILNTTRPKRFTVNGNVLQYFNNSIEEGIPENLGTWVGPISGFLFCMLGGFWVARKSSDPVLNGTCMGISGAILDILIVITMSAAFAPILYISNIGRIIGGCMGGSIAYKCKQGTERNVD
jgi:hypothetical protein